MEMGRFSHRWQLGAVFAAAGLMAASTYAAEINWDANGGVGGNWAADVNWSGNVTPGVNDQARIKTASSDANPVVLDTDVGSVQSVRVGLDPSGAGYLRIGSGGAVHATTAADIDGVLVGAGGGNITAHVVQTGGSVVATSRTIVGSNISANSVATYDLSGGTLDQNMLSVGRIVANSTVVLNQTGGAVIGREYNFGARIGESLSGASTAAYNMSGGTLHTITGGMVIYGNSGGQTATWNVSGSAKIQLDKFLQMEGLGSTIVLNGSKTGDGTDVQIAQNFRFSYLTAGSVLRALFDAAAIADPSAMRKIVSGGNFEMQGHAGLLDVGFTFGTDAPLVDTTWTILTWTGAAPNPNLSFAPGVDTDRWSFNLDTLGKTLSVTYTAVPEPAALALLGLGGLMMMRRRR